jgi:hypothetical protein
VGWNLAAGDHWCVACELFHNSGEYRSGSAKRESSKGGSFQPRTGVIVPHPTRCSRRFRSNSGTLPCGRQAAVAS